MAKQVKPQADYTALHHDTTIEVVAILPDGSIFIFDMNILKWQRMVKKPGVYYCAFQKGFSSFKGAIRKEYKE